MNEEPYRPRSIESKWREYWKREGTHRVEDSAGKPKYYCLDMFPYPSGAGLHVGHWRGYVLSDVWSRYKRLQGYSVLHPMGWDAFGLPAENDAVQKGIHPAVSTERNIGNFKRQLYEIGAMYDWSREINTSDPSYYRWTQWIFLRMYEEGLAYRKEMPINWCPECATGLANEEVVGGACERCGARVTRRPMEQWMLRITAYADRLLEGLERLDWPEKVKRMQSHWIGRSEGVLIDFAVPQCNERLRVFTTRPDTLFGATYVVLAPEHPLLPQVTTDAQRRAVERYVESARQKSDRERMGQGRSGVFTGGHVENPVNGERLPVWVSDYVLMEYGTGAIMAVPAHDERDFAFARAFDLPIRRVVAPSPEAAERPMEEAFTGKGTMVNSGPLSGLDSGEGGRAVTEALRERGLAESSVTYRLRDWVFSRQRYWGEPIPIVYCVRCARVPVPECELPILLPHVEEYRPTGTGKSPLAAIPWWISTSCPNCGREAKRETDTMPQWAGSSWYFLRYTDPHNGHRAWDPERARFWMPVDMYVGGVEHAILHLLYARFFTMFLYDIGVAEFEEPFARLFNQGMICRHGSKMSKSRPNVVSPDPLVEKYGSDSLRLYELFVGPPELDSEWNDAGVEGVYRFLCRTWQMALTSVGRETSPRTSVRRETHGLVKTVTERLESMKLNTIVSAFMEYVNQIMKEQAGEIDRKSLETFLTLLAPFAPHMAEEIWERLGNEGSIFETAQWPEYDPEVIRETLLEIPVQVNGRVRDAIEVAADSPQHEVIARAKDSEIVRRYLERGRTVREVYVPGRIVSFVVQE